MATRYKIRARVLPVELTGITEGIQDATHEEQRLLIPMDGVQTIGDLFYEIRRIYAELYNKSRELRIRCLETENGELLHTSLLISDCFERRIDSTISSQWTVIVRRQAPTEEELAEHKRNIRQLSFDDESFVRPQFSSIERLVIAPQEVSASPMRSHLAVRVPVQSDPVRDIIPSTERDIRPAEQSLAVRQPQTSPTLVPNSQEALNGAGDSQNAMPGKVANTQVQSKASTITKTKLPKSSKPSAPRKDIYDIDSIDEQVQTSRKMSPEQQLPENHVSLGRPSVPLDDRPPARKAHLSSRKTPSIEPSRESEHQDNGNESNAREAGVDKSTVKLSAGIAETQKLVATLPTTPSSRRIQKLTPFFPHSATKLTPGSSRNESVQHAMDTGTEVSRAEKSSATENKQSQSRFAPDRFKETDRKTLSAFSSKQIPNGKGSGETPLDKAKIVKPKQVAEAKSATEVVDMSDSEEEVEKPQRPNPAQSPEKGDDEPEVSEDDESMSNVIPKEPIQKPLAPVIEKKKRGRPAGSKGKATLLKMASKSDDPLSNKSLSPGSKKSEDEQNPLKKKKGRPSGSKDKPNNKPNKLPKLDANGEPIKKRRGRPPGSKGKNKNDLKTKQAILSDKDSETPSKAKSQKKDSVESDKDNNIEQPNSDTDDSNEQSDVDSEVDQNGSSNKIELSTLAKTNERKRKADNDDATAHKSGKRAKTTTDSPLIANADAMDESEDRTAVIAAADNNRQESTMRSYSRSPAKEVHTSSSEESYDTDTASETSEEAGSATSSASQAAKTTRSNPSKTNPVTKDIPAVKVSSPLGQSSKEEKKPVLPTKSRLPSSSADQAAAQLQSEDSQSLTTSVPNSKNVNPAVSKRPTLSSSTTSKYPSFKQFSQNVRTNPEFDQKMRQQPKVLQSLTDDSDSSSGSDSDSEDELPKKNNSQSSHSKRSLKGFRGLLNRKPTK